MAGKHEIHRVVSFRIAGPYRLIVSFADGVVRDIDFSGVLEGDLYGPLRDEQMFDAVRLDPTAHTLVWPNGADFDPATLHDWPELDGELHAMARRWSAAARRSGRATKR